MLSISIAVFLVHSLLCSPCWARVAVCLWNSLFIVLCLRDSVVAPWAAGPLLFCSLSSVASVYTHTSNQTLVSFYCQSSSTIILHVSMDILIHSFSTPPHFSFSTPSLLDDSVLHPPTQVFLFIYSETAVSEHLNPLAVLCWSTPSLLPSPSTLSLFLFHPVIWVRKGQTCPWAVQKMCGIHRRLSTLSYNMSLFT